MQAVGVLLLILGLIFVIVFIFAIIRLVFVVPKELETISENIIAIRQAICSDKPGNNGNK